MSKIITLSPEQQKQLADQSELVIVAVTDAGLTLANETVHLVVTGTLDKATVGALVSVTPVGIELKTAAPVKTKSNPGIEFMHSQQSIV